MRKQAALLTLSSIIGGSAIAADAPILPQVPNAGTLLQQTQPGKPPAALPDGSGLTIEQANGISLPASAPFVVKEIRISGNTSFDNATLHALVAGAEGKSLTLTQLGDGVNRITAFYREHGYPLARAIVPAQTIQAGVVRVDVIEARYGKIKLDNHSRTDDPLLQSTLAPLQGGQMIAQPVLDRSLLLLSDIPGAVTSATLKPGDAVGTSDLQVDVGTSQAVAANATADDYGNRYTGRDRLSGTFHVFAPLHRGDVFSANLLTTGSGMEYARLAYDTLLSGMGTRLGGAYSVLHYTLGDTLAALDGHGTAQITSLWLKHPLLRRRDFNLYTQLQYDHKRLDDEIDASNIHTDRHLDNLTATLSGDWRDGWMAGEMANASAWSLAWTQGRLNFDSAQAQGADAATARTQGSFAKWTASATRLQSFRSNNALYFALSGQWASGNLDASEKMVAGGPYTVRAYDMGVVSGDSGILGSIEFRHDFEHLQAIAFIDSEHVTVNHTTWAPGINAANLSGAGAGLNWFGPRQWSAKATIATPVGTVPNLVGGDKSVRAWVEVDKGF